MLMNYWSEKCEVLTSETKCQKHISHIYVKVNKLQYNFKKNVERLYHELLLFSLP